MAELQDFREEEEEEPDEEEEEETTETVAEELEIYLAYNRLTAADLGHLLSNLSAIATQIADDYFIRFGDRRTVLLPTLDVKTANTGNSIKFSFVEGWKINIKNNEEGDIVVGVLKALGIPVLIGYLLVNTATAYQDMRGKQQEYRIRKMDERLKAVELIKAISPDTAAKASVQPGTLVQQNTFVILSSYLDNKVPEVKLLLTNTVKAVLRNPYIHKFSVNGIELKHVNR